MQNSRASGRRRACTTGGNERPFECAYGPVVVVPGMAVVPAGPVSVDIGVEVAVVVGVVVLAVVGGEVVAAGVVVGAVVEVVGCAVDVLDLGRV